MEHESGTCSGTMMWVLGHPGDFHSLWWGSPSCDRQVLLQQEGGTPTHVGVDVGHVADVACNLGSQGVKPRIL